MYLCRSRESYRKVDIDPLPSPYSPLPGILAAVGHTSGISFSAPPDWAVWAVIVAVALVCMMLSAFMSGSEIAFFGLDTATLDDMEEENTAETRRVLNLVNHSDRLLATILIGNNLVNITMVILLDFAINQTVQFTNGVLEFLIKTVLLTFLLLLFGEVLPKLTARGRAEQWAKATAGAMTVAYRLFAPLSCLMVRSSAFVSNMVERKRDDVTADDLSQALEITDVKEQKDKEMLESILTLGEKQASDIMIPRMDVTALDTHSTWKEVIATVLESGYSRIPVYESDMDDIRGILYSKDLLPWLEHDREDFEWQRLVRKAYFVPESRMIDDLLQDFRVRKVHIAVVVDEYGGTQGIVTLEDILEEIVGEIDDEYDLQEQTWKRIAPGVFRFSGKTPLVDFFRATDLDEDAFPQADDAETIAGLLLAVKGDFPRERETIEVAGCRFTVLKMDRHRIDSVMVRLPEPDKSDNIEDKETH